MSECRDLDPTFYFRCSPSHKPHIFCSSFFSRFMHTNFYLPKRKKWITRILGAEPPRMVLKQNSIGTYCFAGGNWVQLMNGPSKFILFEIIYQGSNGRPRPKWQHDLLRMLSSCEIRREKIPVGIFWYLPSGVLLGKWGESKDDGEESRGTGRKPGVDGGWIQFWRITATEYRECSIYFGGEPIKWRSVRQFFFSTKAFGDGENKLLLTQLRARAKQKKNCHARKKETSFRRALRG